MPALAAGARGFAERGFKLTCRTAQTLATRGTAAPSGVVSRRTVVVARLARLVTRDLREAPGFAILARRLANLAVVLASCATSAAMRSAVRLELALLACFTPPSTSRGTARVLEASGAVEGTKLAGALVAHVLVLPLLALRAQRQPLVARKAPSGTSVAAVRARRVLEAAYPAFAARAGVVQSASSVVFPRLAQVVARKAAQRAC